MTGLPPQCVPLSDKSKLDGYELYVKDSKFGCSVPVSFLKSPMFFGNDVSDNKPIFAVMSYKQFEHAKVGMIVAAVSAAVLGVASLLLGVKVVVDRKNRRVI